MKIRSLLIALLAAALLNFSGSGWAAQKAEQQSAKTQEADPSAKKAADDKPNEEDQSFLRRLFAGRRASIYERNHSSVKEAFRNVADQVELSTVRVLCNDRPAALGAVVDAEGFVLTKASELKGEIQCETRDGKTHEATLVGLDAAFDLAMLKIETPGLTAVQWAETAPAVGSWVITTGLGDLPQAVGVVSVGPRRIGGGVLGVWLNEDEGGPKIMGIEPNSGGAKAGLKVNDLVLEVDGQLVATRQALIGVVSSHPPGARIKLTVQRGDETLDIAALLGRRSEMVGQGRSSFQNNLGGPLSDRRDAFPAALQHDTILRPIECGGPLADLEGHVIGLNIARAGRVVSYALPVDVVRPRLAALMSGKLSPASLKRRKELEENVEQWTQRAAELRRSLSALTAKESDIQTAAEADGAEPEAIDAWKKLQDQRADLERAEKEAQQELELAKAELNGLGD